MDMKWLSKNSNSNSARFCEPRKSVVVSLFFLFLFTFSTALGAVPKPGEIDDKIKQIKEAMEKGLKDDIDILKLKILIKELKNLEKDKPTNKTNQEDINDAIKKAEDQIEAAEPEKSLSDLIGDTKPLTAVLFSTQDRNVFEVVRKKPKEDDSSQEDDSEPDGSIGQINQSQEGDTGGILIAAEAPFLYPKTGKAGWLPIGAWFGVRLQNGSGSDISDVDLASGISVSFLRQKDFKDEPSQFGKITSSAKLLLGALYGDVVRLGGGFQPGDDFTFGDAIPLIKEKDIEFTMGIGFRF